MIYLISFLEALSGGLVGINIALYFKFTLGLSEVQAASIFSIMGVLGGVFILLLGPLVDKIGIKRAMLIGASTLAIGRLVLGYTHSLILALSLLIFMAIGSAIKGSSVLIALRNQGKSFKLDYIIFNLAYCLSGFIFDFIHNYQLTFILAGVITLFNLLVVFRLPNIPGMLGQKRLISEKGQKVTFYDYKTLKTVIIYNVIMLPVSGIFTFMASFVPKWAIASIGPDAPVGKLYGSLNPAIILLIVPLFIWINRRLKLDPYKTAIIGTTISALSLFLIAIPTIWLYSAIITIAIFTIGEAIWSPANMEVGTKLCPEGQEGKYLTISLIPRTLVGFLMSYGIAYEFNHFVYHTNPYFAIPFIHMGLFALLTPLGLLFFKKNIKHLV